MRISFIGAGNMAGAIISGILAKGIVSANEITAADLTDHVSERFGIHFTNNNREAAENADILFLSVKPQIYPAVIEEIRDLVTSDQLIITIAPGKTLQWLKDSFGGKELKIIRTMPNTPAMVQEGMTAVCPNEHVTDEDLQTALTLLGSFSRTEVVPEHLMDVVTSVSGSSPASRLLWKVSSSFQVSPLIFSWRRRAASSTRMPMLDSSKGRWRMLFQTRMSPFRPWKPSSLGLLQSS